MDKTEKMRAAVAAYFTHFNNADPAGIASIFADDATVEDPIGTPPKLGIDEIRAFYEMAVQSGSRLEQQGETRVAENHAAFAFTVHIGSLTAENTAVDVDIPTGKMQIDVIDTFDFNDDGEVTAMRAFWGPGNIRQ